MAVSSSSSKPRLSFWEIWNMSFGFLGIQFGFELQNSNVSRIFETLGANKDEIPILWIAAPVTGLFVQPIIGYLSDRTWHPYWGRRRPFFFIGAVLATIALLVMPNSPVLWIAGGMLWIMDASINISMEPFRAFVGDKLPDDQRTAGFAMQATFIGIGSVIAALLPWVFTNWFHVNNQAPTGIIPDSVKWSFYLGGICYLGAVMYTVFTSKEYPPDDLDKLKEENRNTTILKGLRESYQGILTMPKTMLQLAFVQFFTWFALFSMWIYSNNAVTSTIYDMKVNRTLYEVIQKGVAAAPDTTDHLATVKADVAEINRFQNERDEITLTINLANFYLDPSNAQLFHGTEADQAAIRRVQSQYNEGANFLGVASSAKNAITAIFAFILPIIAFRTSRKVTHFICLVVGGVGLISLSFIVNPSWIVLSMAMVGVAWASILSMPYAILSGSLPTEKMGYYMGVFNFFIVIPQILAATVLGFLTVHVFNGNTMSTLILGGGFMILAGLLSLMVKDDK